MKNKMFLALLLVVLSFSFYSCSGRKQSPPKSEDQSEQQSKKGYIIYVNKVSPNKNIMYYLNIENQKSKSIIDKSVSNASGLGEKIAYIAEDDLKKQTLNMVNADGSDMITIMNDTYIKGGSLSWSPDGKRIAYAAQTPLDKGSQIYYVEAGEYKTPIKVTDDDCVNENPSFSNDGRLIVYAKNSGTNFDIYKYDLVSKTNQNISNNTADDISPVVSEEGTRIFFLSDEAEKGKYDLYSMGIDGENRMRLTIGQNIEKGSIRVSPDSSMISFISIGEKGDKSVNIIDMKKSIQMVSSGGYASVWSNDSKMLYFAVSDQENRKIIEYDTGEKKMKEVLKMQIKPGEEAQGIMFLHFTDRLK